MPRADDVKLVAGVAAETVARTAADLLLATVSSARPAGALAVGATVGAGAVPTANGGALGSAALAFRMYATQLDLQLTSTTGAKLKSAAADAVRLRNYADTDYGHLTLGDVACMSSSDVYRLYMLFSEGLALAGDIPILWSNTGLANDAKLTCVGRSASGVVSIGTTAVNGLGTLQALGITTVAGSALAFAATAPAATAGSQAGLINVYTAPNAVDGSSTHAAANGGAHRFVVGNAVNGGKDGYLEVITMDSTTGFRLRPTPGVAGLSLRTVADTAYAPIRTQTAYVLDNSDVVSIWLNAATDLRLGSAIPLGWSSSTNAAAAAFDTCAGRSVAGVFSFGTTAVNGLGTLQALGITTVAGSPLAFTATAPAAITTAQAGVGETHTASAAVAGSSVAGAAAGGGYVYTTGNAARNASGVAAAGDFRIATGTNIGGSVYYPGLILTDAATGVKGGRLAAIGAGQVAWWNGASGTTLGSFFSRDFQTRSDDLNSILAYWTGVQFRLASGGFFGFNGSATDASAAMDVTGYRVAASVFGIGTTGATGAGSAWLAGDAGKRRLTAAVPLDTITLANLTALTVTLPLGNFGGYLEIPINLALAADGVQIDFGGGTAVVSSVHFGFSAAIGATLGTRTSTSLTTPITLTALADTSDVWIEVPFVCVVSTAGTVIPRIAKVADVGGDLTVRIGGVLFVDYIVT